MNWKALKILPAAALLMLGVVAAGCDSDSENGTSDEELFIGTWAVVGASDDSGDQSAVFAMNFNSIVGTFQADGSVNIVIDAVDDAGDQTLAGTYTVVENAGTLTVTIPGSPLPLSLSYTFNGDDEFEGSASAAVLNAAFGTTLTGTATITFQRQ